MAKKDDFNYPVPVDIFQYPAKVERMMKDIVENDPYHSFDVVLKRFSKVPLVHRYHSYLYKTYNRVVEEATKLGENLVQFNKARHRLLNMDDELEAQQNIFKLERQETEQALILSQKKFEYQMKQIEGLTEEEQRKLDKLRNPGTIEAEKPSKAKEIEDNLSKKAEKKSAYAKGAVNTHNKLKEEEEAAVRQKEQEYFRKANNEGYGPCKDIYDLPENLRTALTDEIRAIKNTFDKERIRS